jgi:hypothetical protein
MDTDSGEGIGDIPVEEVVGEVAMGEVGKAPPPRDGVMVGGEVVQDIHLPCGCVYTAKFTHGDRRHGCRHGRVWVVSANMIRTVRFSVSEKVELVSGDEG